MVLYYGDWNLYQVQWVVDLVSDFWLFAWALNGFIEVNQSYKSFPILTVSWIETHTFPLSPILCACTTLLIWFHCYIAWQDSVVRKENGSRVYNHLYTAETHRRMLLFCQSTWKYTFAVLLVCQLCKAQAHYYYYHHYNIIQRIRFMLF